MERKSRKKTAIILWLPLIIVLSCLFYIIKGNNFNGLFVTKSFWLDSFLISLVSVTCGMIVGYYYSRSNQKKE